MEEDPSRHPRRVEEFSSMHEVTAYAECLKCAYEVLFPLATTICNTAVPVAWFRGSTVSAIVAAIKRIRVTDPIENTF